MHPRTFAFVLCVAAMAMTCALAAPGCGDKAAVPAEKTSPGTATGPPGGTDPTGPSGETRSTQPSHSSTAPPGDETADVEAASAAAMADANSRSPGLGELEVLAVRISGDWARVDMRPADGSADKASWLLRKTGGAWRVVDRGTTLLPTDHPDAPDSVFR